MPYLTLYANSAVCFFRLRFHRYRFFRYAWRVRIDDVAISTLTLVGPNGVQGKIPLKLTDEEVAKLQKSANSLKEVISQIEL